MIVDDQYLRIGSANLCNRSMATDSECDLVFVAGDTKTVQEIRKIRLDLIAEHCGCAVKNLATAIERQGSLIKAIHTMAVRSGRVRFISADQERAVMPILKSIADPKRPTGIQHVIEPVSACFRSRKVTWTFVITMLVGFCALTAA